MPWCDPPEYFTGVYLRREEMRSVDNTHHSHQDRFAFKYKYRPSLTIYEVRHYDGDLIGVLMQDIPIHLCLGKLLPHHDQGRHVLMRGRSDYTSCSHDTSRLYCIVVPPTLTYVVA